MPRKKEVIVGIRKNEAARISELKIPEIPLRSNVVYPLQVTWKTRQQQLLRFPRTTVLSSTTEDSPIKKHISKARTQFHLRITVTSIRAGILRNYGPEALLHISKPPTEVYELPELPQLCHSTIFSRNLRKPNPLHFQHYCFCSDSGPEKK